MTKGSIQLRDFSEAELIFDEQETRDILKFFFPVDFQQIENIQITSEIRNLAQGLLIEAVDATYAMSWMEQTFKWVGNPGLGMKKVLQKLANRATRHWFKNLKRQSIFNLKIYESIRAELSNAFRHPFQIILQAKDDRKNKSSFMAFVNYESQKSNNRAWG